MEFKKKSKFVFKNFFYKKKFNNIVHLLFIKHFPLHSTKIRKCIITFPNNLLLFHFHTSPQKNIYIELTFWSWTDACEKLMHKSTHIQLSMHWMLLFSIPRTKHFIHSSYWETCERVRLCILWHFANFIDCIFGVASHIKIFQFTYIVGLKFS